MSYKNIPMVRAREIRNGQPTKAGMQPIVTTTNKPTNDSVKTPSNGQQPNVVVGTAGDKKTTSEIKGQKAGAVSRGVKNSKKS